MQLLIGDRNYSSWVLRAWLGLKVAAISFEEIVMPLRVLDSKWRRFAFSPAGKLPLLVDGHLKIWDSLAIAEYVAEKHPEKNLWPQDQAVRAVARAVCAEMHSGFAALRLHCPIDVCRRIQKTLPDEVWQEIDRIVSLWIDCRSRFGSAGPFLFGSFSWADAYYAPVVTRFVTYRIPLPGQAQTYVDTMMALPAMQEWIAAARAEIFKDGKDAD